MKVASESESEIGKVSDPEDGMQDFHWYTYGTDTGKVRGLFDK